jgi:hypothetical protein
MLAVTAEDIKKIGQVKAMLLNCSREKDIDAVFDRFGVSDFSVKTMLLRQTMQVQDVFGTPDLAPSNDEAAYREELGFFLDGKWRDLI